MFRGVFVWKFWITLGVLLLVFWGFIHWLDTSMQKSFYNQWIEIRRQDTFNYNRVMTITRLSADSSIREFSFKGGSGYHCFEYEKGFDKYLQVGDLILKKNGEFRLTVIKSNDSASFWFVPRSCDSMEFLYPDGYFFTESIYRLKEKIKSE